MKLRFALIALLCVLPVAELKATGTISDQLTVYTEENPPFSYVENGEAKGLYVDLILELFSQLGIQKKRSDIIVAPWSRAFKETKLRKNSMLFSMVRSPERESSFKWVGPIGEYRPVLYARRDRALDLKESKGLSQYRYGLTKNSQVEKFLLKAGATQENFLYFHSPKSAAEMLARGRIDAWARDFSVAHWTLQDLGYDIKEYQVVHTFEVQSRYIALNKETDEAFIRRFQEKLDALDANGMLAAITKSKSMAQAASNSANR